MPNYGRYQFVLVEVANGVATLTLNRPEQLNAINPQMHLELEDVLAEVSEDPDVRAVVITGAGRAFCAGGDINAMKEDEEFLKASWVVDGPRRLIHNLVNVKQPVVCALNGFINRPGKLKTAEAGCATQRRSNFPLIWQ